MTPDQWLAALGAIPLSYQPGERFHYSHSTDVLGFLVGTHRRHGVARLPAQRIFEPLQMHDTDFWTPPEKRDRAAVVYRPDAQSGQLQPVPFPEYDRAAGVLRGRRRSGLHRRRLSALRPAAAERRRRSTACSC